MPITLHQSARQLSFQCGSTQRHKTSAIITVHQHQTYKVKGSRDENPSLAEAAILFKACAEKVCTGIRSRICCMFDCFPYALYLCASVGKQSWQHWKTVVKFPPYLKPQCRRAGEGAHTNTKRTRCLCLTDSVAFTCAVIFCFRSFSVHWSFYWLFQIRCSVSSWFAYWSG